MSAIEAFLKVVRGRRSIRKFRPDPVEKATIDAIIEAAGWAPSAGNRQDCFFTVITSSEIKREMADAVRARWREIIDANRSLGGIEDIEKYSAHFADFTDAPAVIVVSSTVTNAVQKHLLGEDAWITTGSATSAAMAAQNLMLAAYALGLGTCCMTGALAARKELTRIIGLGRRREIICLITLGTPAEAPSPPSRKPVTEVTRSIE